MWTTADTGTHLYYLVPSLQVLILVGLRLPAQLVYISTSYLCRHSRFYIFNVITYCDVTDRMYNYITMSQDNKETTMNNNKDYSPVMSYVTSNRSSRQSSTKH